MAEKREATHSLSTEILMAMEFNDGGTKNQIDAIATAVKNLDEPFTNVKSVIDELNKNPLKGIIESLRGLTIDSTNINAKELRTAIEDKIKTAIVKSKISFIGDDGGPRKIEVEMGPDFWEKNKRAIEKSIAESLTNIVVKEGKIPQLDITDILRDFNEKFNSQVSELVKNEGLFDLYVDDKRFKSGRKLRYQADFKLTEESVGTIMKALQDSFVEYLSDPNNITIDEMPPLEIKSDELNKIIQKISDSIGDIDKLIKIDPETIKDLPNINKKLEHFRDSLTDLISDINRLAGELESLKVGSITESDLKKASTSIENLKNKVIVNIDKWANQVAKELGKSLKPNTDLIELKLSIDSLNEYVNTLMVNKLNKLQEDISTINEKRDTLDTAEIQQIPNMIIEQISKIVVNDFLNTGALDIKLDTGFLDDEIDKWKSEFYIELSATVDGLLNYLSDGIDSVLDMADIGVNGVISSHLQKLEALTKELGIADSEIDKVVDIENLRSEIKEALSVKSLGDIGLDSEEISKLSTIISSEIGKLNDKVIKELNKFYKNATREVDKSVKSYATERLEEFKNELNGLNQSINTSGTKSILSDKDLSKVNKTIKTKVNKMIDDYINDIAIAPFSKDFDNNLIQDINEGFAEKVYEMVGLRVLSYTESLKNYFGTVSYSDRDQVTEILETFRGPLTKLVDSSVHDILTDITYAVSGAVESLRSEVENSSVYEEFKLQVDSEIKGLINHTVNQTITSMRQLFDSYHLTNDTMQSMKAKIEREVNDIVQKLQIQSKDTSEMATIDIGESMQEVKIKIQKAINDVLGEFSVIERETEDIAKSFRDASDILGFVGGEIAESIQAFETNSKSLESMATELLNTITNEINNATVSYIKKVSNEIVQKSSEFTVPKSHITTVERSFRDLTRRVVNQVKQKLEEIDLTTEQKLKIKLEPTLKKIERELKNQLDNISFTIVNGEEISVDSTRLNTNVDKFVQKLVNTKATQIGKMRPTSVEATLGIDRLQVAIGEYIKKAIDGYDVAIKESATKKFSAKGMGYIFDKVMSVFNRSFYTYAQQISKSFEDMTIDDFSMRTRELDSETKKKIADRMGVTPSELARQIPEFKGAEYGKEIMRANVEVITDSVSKLISTSIKTLMDYYKESIKDTEIAPDSNLTGYILDEIIKLQDAIVKKVKTMVRDQFKFLTEEIKAMNIDAKSLGYRPTQEFDKAVARANPNLLTSTGMTVGELKEHIKTAVSDSKLNIDNVTLSNVAVTADGIININADDIRARAVNKLVTEAPQVVVNGKVVDLNAKDFDFSNFTLPLENYLEKLPFNNEMNTLLPSLNRLRADDFLKGSKYSNPYSPLNPDSLLFDLSKPNKGKHGLTKIFENMARYFFVGYALQLPIKAITSANKVSSELDYRVAKAKQNILIKDPTMENTARNVVYERYTSEGKNVGGGGFQEDVKREAAKLRTMMNTEMNDYLINIAKAYYQDIGKVGKYYEIASRRSTNPYEALTKTREIAKILAAESDMDSEFAGTGLEALSAQWGLRAGELDRYTNMMLKTAMLSNTTVTDLLSAQRDTAAMFKERLGGMEQERSYATAMALSSMFVESTGKSGREAGTFWRNVLQRPYVKDSRKYIEAAGQYEGFESLDPYYTDERGVRRQKDFLTMFSDIMEAAIRIDDPSRMTMLSEIFPIRTIGGAESVMALINDMKDDFEKTMEQLKQTGELDPTTTLETVNVKDVIEKYVDKIMDVTDRDIAGYIAGLQDTTKFNWQGVATQWESTVYGVFMEFKEEASLAMTYLTSVLKMFEKNSGALSEVIKVFGKIGAGLTGKNLINLAIEKLNTKALSKPTDFQKTLSRDYSALRIAEHSSRNRREAIEIARGSTLSERDEVGGRIESLKVQQQELNEFIEYQRKLDRRPKDTPKDHKGKSVLQINDTREYRDEEQLRKAVANKRHIDDDLYRLQDAYKDIDLTLNNYNNILATAEQEHNNIKSLSEILYDNIGARDVESFERMFSDLYRNEYAYKEVARLAVKSKIGFNDTEYGNKFKQKELLEAQMSDLKRSMFENDERRRVNAELIQAPKAKREDVVEARKANVELVTEYAEMDKGFKRLSKELDSINKEILEMNVKKLEAERIIFEAERPKVTPFGQEEKSTREIMGLYRDLMPSMGINTQQFESGLDNLANMFKEGKLDVDMYEDSLRDISRQLGISEKDFTKFKESVRQINAEIQLGKASVFEYITALKSARTYGSGIITTGAGDPSKVDISTGGTSDALKAVAGLTATGAVIKGGGLKGLLAKLSNTFKGAGSVKAVGAAKAIPGMALKLGTVYATTDLIGKAMGGVAERGMTDADRLTNEADRYESMINKLTGFSINPDDSVGAVIGKSFGKSAVTLYESIASQINRWAGGTAPSFKDVWAMYEAATNANLTNPDMTRDEIANMLKELFDVEYTRFEGNIMKQEEYLSQNPFLTYTGEKRDFTEEESTQIPLEELMNFIERELNILNRNISRSDAQFTQTRLRLLIQGMSEDSKEMRDAVKEHLNRNISELEQMVNSFKEYLLQLRPGSENYNVVKMQILDLENKLDESRLGLLQNEFSEFDALINRYNRDNANLQAKYDIKRYDALLSGIKEDSGAIKQIDSKLAETQINAINTLQGQLQSLADQFKDNPDRQTKIFDQILQLDVEKRKLLYDIREKMPGTLSTFNLPSEIQPMTYYEAMTRRNTHKNMSILSGDTIVNVNVANLSGEDEDLEKLSNAVNSAVVKAQKEFVRQFANDVKTGMGNNYYSWHKY